MQPFCQSAPAFSKYCLLKIDLVLGMLVGAVLTPLYLYFGLPAIGIACAVFFMVCALIFVRLRSLPHSAENASIYARHTRLFLVTTLLLMLLGATLGNNVLDSRAWLILFPVLAFTLTNTTEGRILSVLGLAGMTLVFLGKPNDYNLFSDATILIAYLSAALVFYFYTVQLEESRGRLDAYATTSSDWQWETDENLRFSYFSENFRDCSGENPSCFIGKSMRDLLTAAPENALDRITALAGQMERHEPFRELEFCLRGLGGNALNWFTYSGMPVFGPHGKFSGYRGTGRDITKQHSAEATLREREEHYRLLLQHTPVGILHYDHDLMLTYCNKRLSQILQVDKDRLLGLKMGKLKDQSVLPTLREALAGNSSHYDGPYTSTLSGASIWISMDCAPLLGGNGEILGGVAIVEDISARKRLEDELRTSENYLRLLLDSLPMALFAKDARNDFRFTAWNRMSERLFGLKREDVIGRNDYDFFPKAQSDFFRSKDEAVIRGNALFDIAEEPIDTKNQGRRLLHTIKVAIPDSDGNPRYLLGISEDVTARKEAEIALQETSAALRELNETLEQRVYDQVQKNLEQERLLTHQSRLAAMGEMIGNIAHQWRQPINALALLLANLKDAYEYGELTRETLDETLANGNRIIQKMSSTIDDFRNFFRPDKEKSNFSLDRVVAEILDILSASLRNNAIQAEVEIEPGIMVYGYTNEYSQVLLNLLNNAKDAVAAHHRAGGKIRIRAEQRDGMAVLTIADNGGGIPAEIRDKIFDPYFTTKEKGTGIGLYMSKLIVENNMGGRIAAQNVEEGAEFTISCPLAPAASP